MIRIAGVLIACFLLVGWSDFARLQIVPSAVEQSSVQPSDKNTETKETQIQQEYDRWYSSLLDPITFFTFFLMVFTGYLAFSTRGLWRETKKLADLAGEQAKDTQKSIVQAVRSAKASEALVKEMRSNFKTATEHDRRRQRAYLAIKVGGGIRQHRGYGFPFEVKPILENVGFTPANRVRYKAKADVLPWPIPDDFNFSVHAPPESNLTLPPRGTLTLSAIMDDFIDDSLVAEVKSMFGTQRLYVWGEVHYEDIFSKSHRTCFCYSVYWLPNPDGTETVRGDYTRRHNDADWHCGPCRATDHRGSPTLNSPLVSG